MDYIEQAQLLLDQSSGAIGLIECLEISHPKWGQVYRFVMRTNEPLINNSDLMLRHEDGQLYAYKIGAIEVQRSSDGDTLDQQIGFSFNDLGETFANLVDLYIHDEVIELPIANYRNYLGGNYEQPFQVVRNLEVGNITMTDKGSKCEAKAPSLNENGNGSKYSVTTHPSLASFY
ncbi:hypothetical protein ACG93R_19980 [Acinetobacter guillouiae]|uniref:hypothetical protein n=1 Tax=Acinetobacter guillouiae TaxID=106649 RepID=UPI003AF62ADC